MQLYWNPSSIELITIEVQLAGFLSEHCSDHAGLQFRDARQCCVLLHVCTVAKKNCKPTYHFEVKLCQTVKVGMVVFRVLFC